MNTAKMVQSKMMDYQPSSLSQENSTPIHQIGSKTPKRHKNNQNIEKIMIPSVFYNQNGDQQQIQKQTKQGVILKEKPFQRIPQYRNDQIIIKQNQFGSEMKNEQNRSSQKKIKLTVTKLYNDMSKSGNKSASKQNQQVRQMPEEIADEDIDDL